MRVLHIGKYLPPDMGGMESFLGDLLGAQSSGSVHAGAVVHAGERSAGVVWASEAGRVWRVPMVGQFLYTPVSPSFSWRLGEAIRRFQPDLLHIHLPNPSAFCALVSPAARALPWVVHWHSDVVFPPGRAALKGALRTYRVFERRLLERAECVIATSPPYAASSLPLAPYRHKVQIVPLGLDPRRLESTDSARAWAETQWNASGLRLLGVGRLAHYKGFDTLIHALEQAKDVQARVVGEGEMYEALDAQIQGAALTERVRLMGACSDDQRNALLRSCDALVLPSVERTEAFGVVLLEAMALGKPVIASAIPGSGPTWVVDAQTHGWHVNPGDVDDLARVLTDCAADEGKRLRYGAAGRERFERNFHIDAVATRLADVYRDVLRALRGAA
jgi:glycosyltransferase involved in cell wall biosynthesis